MRNRALWEFVNQLRHAAQPGELSEVGDGQLLRRFAAERDEVAFTLLLQRHGPMVWGVCRRLLTATDADDAFQATFLVLVRKAGSIVQQNSLAGWLYRVAYRVALRARSNARARQQRETTRAAMTEAADTSANSDLRELLDQELQQLPEKYRAPLVLCYLQGKTNDEAAELLGWTRGTVAGRMSRARELLRQRLARRGLGFASGTFAAVLAETCATVAMPAALTQATLQTALTCAAGVPLTTPAVSLAQGVLQSMWTTKLKLAALLLMVILAGIGLAQLPTTSPAPPPKLPLPDPDQPAAPLEVAQFPARVPLKSDLAAVVQGNNAFALDLYAQLRTTPGNHFFSPFSISTALAMTAAGARGETAAEMRKALHFTLDQQRLHPAMGDLVRQLTHHGQSRGYQLSVANALWMQQGYPFRADFVNLNRQSYGANLQELDFQNNLEQARQTINAWVEKQTRAKIKELVRPGTMDSTTRVALTNAVYFKGEWAQRFPKENTRPDNFTLSTGEKVRLPFMHQKGDFNFMGDDGILGLELPYQGKDLSMIFLLPTEVAGLGQLEKMLTPANVEKWLRMLAPVSGLEVQLPRFMTTAEFRLNDSLVRLGMKQAFQAGVANFSGMADSREICLGPVVHKAHVEVNEAGTVAAAATGVLGLGGEPPVFQANHPFVYLIRDNRSGSILFLGRLVDPRP